MSKFFFAVAALALLATPAFGGSPIDVQGKVALVTGASRGIGEATARVLAKAGIKVVLTARSVSKLETVKADIEKEGGVAASVKCDVSKGSEVKAAFEFATKTFGGVDFVFANAGWEGTGKALEDTEDDEIEQVTLTNTVGYLYTLKYALGAFKANGGGAIIFVSSVGAILPRHMMAAAPLVKTCVPYGVSKASNDYTARIAVGWLADGVRSYGILPGAFETKMLQNIAAEQKLERGTQDMSGFNPYVTDSVGDPVHIGNAALAMFDNSTHYEPGTTVVCDNDVTIPTDTFYEHMHAVKQPEISHGFYQFPLRDDTIRDSKGVPIKREKSDL